MVSASVQALVAVVGTGSIGTRHLRVTAQLPGIQVLAVPRRADRIGTLTAQGYRTATDVRQAAEMGATHAIIATDTGRHVEDGLAALGLGLHVLVEKPMARDAREGLLLRGAAGRFNRTVCVGNVLRFCTGLSVLRDLLEGIGAPHSVRIECQSYLPDWRPDRDYRKAYCARADEGGVLRDLIHEIDYAGWLFGWPRRAWGRLRNLARLGIEAEEAADVQWETAEGCVVSIALDYLSRPPRRGARILGEHGTLEWDYFAGSVTLTVGGSGPRTIPTLQTRDEMLGAQNLAFLGASRGEADLRLATADDGLRALAVCDAVRQASQSGKEQQVDFP